MNITFDYQPMPIHVAFHKSGARERALAGAVGSGKSYAICAEAIAWCLEQPGICGLITRKTIPALRDTTERVFFDILPVELRKAGTISRMGGHVSQFTFPNGSVVYFRGIDDWNKHRSMNLGFIAWDEADEFDEETYNGMATRLRQVDLTNEARELGYTGEITRCGMWCAFNPRGRNWLYYRFVNPDTRHEDAEWWRSTSFDNPYLPKPFLDDLMTKPAPWVKRYVLCQFDDFAGQIYEDWNDEDHLVEPVKDVEGKLVWMGMDPGTENPTAGLWVVINREKRLMVGVAEYEEAGLAATKHTEAWRAIEARKRMRVKRRIADPTITTRDRGSNMGLDEQYRRLGYRFELGPARINDRIPMLGDLIHNRRFKVTKECEKTFRAIKDYQWVDLSPERRSRGEDPAEKPLKKNDHLPNAAQYVASRWLQPVLPPAAQPQYDPLAAAVARHRRGKSRGRGFAHHDLGGIPV